MCGGGRWGGVSYRLNVTEELRGKEQGDIRLPKVKIRNLQYENVLVRPAITLGKDCLHFSTSNIV